MNADRPRRHPFGARSRDASGAACRRARPTPELVALLNSALVVMADHELAASTLAVRVAASTWASPAAAVSSGLGVLSGPLHGSASREGRVLLDRAMEVGAARAVRELRDEHRRVPGFGHRVYPGADPRATLLMGLLHAALADRANRVVAVAEEIRIEVERQIGREPNVDFALATITAATAMPMDAGEVVMAVARTAGWLAHAIEEYSERPLRFRTRAAYIGPR